MSRPRLLCDGDECVRWIEKGRVRNGWTVVVTYPLLDEEATGKRRHLCDRCSRQVERVFK